MRGTRWLLLVAILAILGGVGLTYRVQKRLWEQQSPQKPTSLPLNLNASAEDWQWSQTAEGLPKVQVRARKFEQEKDTSKLEEVELRIFHKEGTEYDLVKSAQAHFNPAERRLYSEGDVEITLGVPSSGTPKKRLISIRSSGVTFESAQGKVSTDRPTSFIFENGQGKAVGASYDPASKELHMNSQVELLWQSPRKGSRPMKLEAGELTYKEAESTIWLFPWARLTRENSVIKAGKSIVHLKDGAIQLVEAQKAQGTDRYPERTILYSADELTVQYTDQGEIEKISGRTNARLVSTMASSETVITTDIIDLSFVAANGESILTKALANGNSVVESKPLPAGGPGIPETRVLRSQTIEMKMRAGGREIETVETHSPGRLEFLPNNPEQRRRTLDGERMSIVYGAQNQIRSFRSVSVSTQTEPSAKAAAKNPTPFKTRSVNLLAEFDSKGQMARMEQWDDFAYEEGDQKAVASRAVLDSSRNLITLETKARFWDSSGSTSGDRIHLDQKTGNFSAEGHVNSSRLPDKNKSGSEMLSGDQPIQAIAQSMTSSNRNRLIHYETNVVLWQGADRLQADRVDIDREKRLLKAHGNVTTQFLEQGTKDGQTTPSTAFTIVKAADLIYTEEDRLARYTGGVLLNRPGLQVKGATLRAYLAESEADSRIEKAYADGRVEIVQTTPDRKRTGTGEHAEYYAGEEKIILKGGQPQLIDSKRGNTRGMELTYFANDDRLLVTGAPEKPVTSRIRRK